jgi:hypothetical protein
MEQSVIGFLTNIVRLHHIRVFLNEDAPHALREGTISAGICRRIGIGPENIFPIVRRDRNRPTPLSKQIPGAIFRAIGIDQVSEKLESNRKQDAGARPTFVPGRQSRAASSSARPLPAIGISGGHARLVGVVVRASQTGAPQGAKTRELPHKSERVL